MKTRSYINPADLERIVTQFREQRDGCLTIADSYRRSAAEDGRGWLNEHNESMASQYDQFHETYRDVVDELESVFPWLKPEPEESEQAA